MKVYKICKRDGKKLVSCSVRPENKIEYKKNRWIYPHKWAIDKGYGLFCFRYKKDAEGFMKGQDVKSPFELWEVQVNKVIGLPKIIPIEIAEKVFSDCILNDPFVALNYPFVQFELNYPRGTIMVDRIKLIRRIK